MSNEDHETTVMTEAISLMNQVSTQLAETIRLVKQNAKRIDEMEAQLVLGVNPLTIEGVDDERV